MKNRIDYITGDIITPDVTNMEELGKAYVEIIKSEGHVDWATFRVKEYDYEGVANFIQNYPYSYPVGIFVDGGFRWFRLAFSDELWDKVQEQFPTKKLSDDLVIGLQISLKMARDIDDYLFELQDEYAYEASKAIDEEDANWWDESAKAIGQIRERIAEAANSN